MDQNAYHTRISTYHICIIHMYQDAYQSVSRTYHHHFDGMYRACIMRISDIGRVGWVSVAYHMRIAAYRVVVTVALYRVCIMQYIMSITSCIGACVSECVGVRCDTCNVRIVRISHVSDVCIMWRNCKRQLSRYKLIRRGYVLISA